MKLNKWLYGVMGLAMLASCSDDKLGPDGPNNGSGSFETTAGEGYIGFSLQLPQQSSTRANDVYEDGLPSEYSIKNAALLLFWGPEDEESNAEFIGAYTIGSDERFDNPNGDNITTSFQNVATLNKKIEKTDGMQLWGLALVNYDPAIFIIGGGESTSPTYGTLKVKAKSIDPDTEDGLSTTAQEIPIPVKKEATTTGAEDAQPGMTFENFRRLVTDQPLYSNTQSDGLKIFMTNAPLSDSQGESTSPNNNNSGYVIQTLAKLDVEKIYDVRETAKVNPAGCIFVERAVAKVSLSNFPLEATLKYQELDQADDGTVVAKGEVQEVTLKITSLGWLLDNEESDSYLIRYAKKSADNDNDIWTIKNSNKYRFVGGVQMNITNEESSGNHDWYRTYWCRDPHYTKNKVFNEQATVNSTYTNLLNTSGAVDYSKVLYPRENTFSVANQNYKNTTRVVFKVQYEWIDPDTKKPLSVYCKAGDPSVIYKLSDAQLFLKDAFISSNTIHDFVLNYVDGETAKNNGIAEGDATNGYHITYGKDDFQFDFETKEVKTTVLGEDGKESVVNEGRLLQIKSVNLAGKLASSIKSTATEAEINSGLAEAMQDANKEVKIRSFANDEGEDNSNICFYATNIQHFGDYYCPIPKNADGTFVNKGITTQIVYENHNRDKYLGRWGMVRNNWYDLNVEWIKTMGFASVPDGNVDTSDDNEKSEFYLSARVHILSWARRSQKVDFK